MCAVPYGASANPQGGVVSAGQASISEAGKKLDIIQQSNKAVIDWRGFDIAPDEHTEFHQPSSNSIALNRVHSTSASQINGQLTANGNVIIVNQNGVLFGQNAKVDVNGLIATTADIDNDQFMQNNVLAFDKPGKPDASIVNAGQITAKEAGLVGLVAPNVINSGTITAKLGRVQLASGDTFVVDMYGDGLMNVAVSDAVKSQLVSNTGVIEAEGGKIALTAAAGKNIVNSLIAQSGALQARSVGMKNGVIIIGAAGSNAVARNVTADKGRKSGSSTVMVSGMVDASGKHAGENGGTVEVTADRIALLDGARIDVAGYFSGGVVRVGGDYLGLGDTPVAKTAFMEQGAVIDVSATTQGNGGKAILFADERTDFYGSIFANGAGVQGNGGFIETSGKNTLNANGKIEAHASQGGIAGEWLLDPADITIGNTATSGNFNIVGGDYTANTNATGSTILGATLNAILDAGTNVTVATGSIGGGGSGDITVNGTGGNIINTTGAGSLTLSAFRNITVSSAITLTGGSLTLRADNTGIGAGRILTSAAINTNGGNITMGGGSGAITAGSGYATNSGTTGYGVENTAAVNAGGGHIIINGRGPVTTTAITGGVNVAGAMSTTGSGTITIHGVGGTGTGNNSRGVRILGVNMSSVDGDITIHGTGGGTGVANGGMGVAIFNAGGSFRTTGSGNITITGIGGNGTGGTNHGVNATVADSILTTVTGNITINGTQGSQASSFGFTPTVANAVRTTGTAGNITINSDTYSLNLANNVVSVGTITIAPLTNISMGVGSGAGVLQFTDTQIGYLNAATGNIFGSTTAGNVEVNTALNFGTRNLSFLSGGDVTLAGNLAKTSGAGTATYLLQANGNIILNAATSASSGNIALNLNATGNVSGNASGTINTNGGLTTVTAGSGSGTLAGVISGTGALTKAGAGTTTFTGANTYTGATTVNGGTLAATLNTTQSGISTSAASIASGATLRLDNLNTAGSTVTAANAFTGLGTLQLAFAAGTTARNTTLSGLAGFTGNVSLTTAGATADKLNMSSSIGGSVTIGNGTTLFMNGTQTITGGASITGTGNTEALGALRLGGALTSDITLTGNSSIGASSGTRTLNGVVSGGFDVTKVGSGTVILTGANTYSGGTTVSAGTLQVGNGGTTGTLGTGAVTNNATLTFNRSDALTVANAISGSGALTHLGAGTTTLSGANTYTGTTTVSAGTLNLSGSLNIGAGTATTVVASGATLAGTGVITAATLSHSGLGNLNLTGNNLVNMLSTSGTLGAIDFNNAQSLATSAMTGISFNIRTTGATSDLTLGGNISASATSGDSIILAAGQDLINSGNRTLTTAGTARWQIYSGDAANATTASPGGLTGFNRYGCTYNAGSPSCAAGTDMPASGNGFYYAFAPTLTITGVTANNKAFNNLTSTTLTGTATFTGAVNGDSLTLAGTPVANFATAAPGTGKAVTVTGYSLVGTNVGYVLAQPTGLTADITADSTSTKLPNTVVMVSQIPEINMPNRSSSDASSMNSSTDAIGQSQTITHVPLSDYSPGSGTKRQRPGKANRTFSPFEQPKRRWLLRIETALAKRVGLNADQNILF